MYDRSCYELYVIWIATATSKNHWSFKSFSSFKTLLKLTLKRIIPVDILQGKFKISCHQNIWRLFRSLRIRYICCLLKKYETLLIGVSFVTFVLKLLLMNFEYAYKALNAFPHADIQNLLTWCHVGLQHLFQPVAVTPNTDFGR